MKFRMLTTGHSANLLSLLGNHLQLRNRFSKFYNPQTNFNTYPKASGKPLVVGQYKCL